MAFLAPLLKQRFEDDNGNPLSGGQVFTYVANTTTPIATYVDQAGVTPNTNPIILDARGECDIYIQAGPAYKFVIQDADGVTIDTVDNVTLADLTDTPIPSGGLAGWVLIKNSDADFDYDFAPPEDFEGPQGKSAYQVWLDEGNVGTEVDFFEALTGDQGDAATVSVGTVTTLTPGSSATVSNVGTSDAAILDFGIPQGVTGAAGRSFYQGSGVPSNGLGSDGDTYLDRDTGNLYEKISGAWESAGTLPLGGAGGGAPVRWFAPEGIGAMSGEEFGAEHFIFANTKDQVVVGVAEVPSDWEPGDYLPRVTLPSYADDTGSFAFRIDSYLVKAGGTQTLGSTDFHFTADTNNLHNVIGPAKALLRTNCAIVDSDYQIGGELIEGQQFIVIKISRIAPSSGTEAAGDVMLLKTAGVYWS